MYSISSASLSDIGKAREGNEDAVLEKGNLFAVADGMGGHQAGEVASELALNVIGQYIEDNLGVIPGEKLVEKAVAAANASVHKKATSSSKYRSMGTTVTMLYREGDTAYIGHVGDSRAYLFRGGSLKQLTRDHSLVAKLVEGGEITEDEARHHPQRNIIMKALGLDPQVEVDVVSVQIQQGDEFLLATDGLTSMVADDQLAWAMASETDPVSATRRLVDLALDAGGTDNVSVVLVSFQASPTMVPVAGAPKESPGDEEPAAGGPKRKSRRRLVIWLAVLVAIFVVLATVFGVGYYFYNRTYFVGVRGGKVTLFKGFPFWDMAVVEKQTDIEARFLPDSLRTRVEGKLEPESRSEALKTIATLEKEAAGNSSIVPNVEGMKFGDARAQIEKVGLKVTPELVSRPGIEPDVVVVQEPAPYARVGKGSTVRLKVVMGGSAPKEV